MYETWNVEEFDFSKGRPRGDGDTVWIKRSHKARLGDDWFLIMDLEPKSHRLVWVDTPERGDEGYDEADKDLDFWILEAIMMGPIQAVVYDGGAGWDRKLCDLINAQGQSASQYLIVEKGWPVYSG